MELILSFSLDTFKVFIIKIHLTKAQKLYVHFVI